MLAHLDVKEPFTKELITVNGKPKSDEQHLPEEHLANTDEGSLSSLEQGVHPSQCIQSENENNALDKLVENAVALKVSASPMLNIKLTWDLPCDVLAHINRFHVYKWSDTKQVWHFLGHTPVGSYTFSLDAQPSDFELAKFKFEAVLITGDLISGVNMNVRNN